MKILIKVLCLICLSTSIFSQSDNNKSHYLKIPTVLAPIDITKIYTKEGLIKGNNLVLDTIVTIQELKIQEPDSINLSLKKVKIIDTVFKFAITIDKNYAYNIIQEIGSFTVIKFWPTKKNNAINLFQTFNKKESSDSNIVKTNLDSLSHFTIKGLKAMNSNKSIVFDLSQNFYLVKTSVLKNNSIDFENKKGLWNIGLLVLPVKARLFATEGGQFDFADGFSVGTTFAWTVHHNWKTNFTHNLLLYVGISSYTGDSLKLKEIRNDYKIATFSPAIGWMWEKNNVQLSILVGVDFPTGNLQKKWVYKNMPWVGVGIGVGLFKIGNEKNNPTQSNK